MGSGSGRSEAPAEVPAPTAPRRVWRRWGVVAVAIFAPLALAACIEGGGPPPPMVMSPEPEPEGPPAVPVNGDLGPEDAPLPRCFDDTARSVIAELKQTAARLEKQRAERK